MSNISRRAVMGLFWASLILGLVACASEAVEQAQVVPVAPTSVPTTAPLSVPAPTPVPAPTSTAVPQATSTPVPTAFPTATVAPVAPPTATVEAAPSPTPASDAAPASTDTEPTVASETPTPVPTPTAEEPEITEDPTVVEETPTAVAVVSGEPPLECFDADVQIYRAYVDGVDALSFDGGRVSCSGAGTNAVSAARSYRHSTGLIVQRNANYIFNEGGTAYIPFSGALHFCVNALPASAPIRADTVPALLVVIDAEAARQVAQGASSPAAFTGSSAQC